MARVTKKVDIAQSYGMVRQFNPKHDALVKMAKLRQMDVSRITEDLYQRAVDGDANDRAALHDFLTYSGHFWNNEEEGTTETGRMFALAGAMEELAQFFDRNPHARMERACQQTALGFDKVYHARAYRFASITKHAGKLYDLALREGKDPKKLVMEQMQRAVDETAIGGVARLCFQIALNNQTFGTTADGRMQARLYFEKLDKSCRVAILRAGRVTL